jgi:hypothetical protein
MPRVDDYYTAADLTREDLRKHEAGEVAEAAGGEIVKESSGQIKLEINFLGRTCTADWPELVFSDRENGKDLTPQEQVLILHYLAGAQGNALTGKWISYQEIPDGRFYMDAFIKRAKNPLVGNFGSKAKLLRELAVSAYGASPFDHGDVSVVFNAFPYVPVVFILWEGDDEFPPDGNILFDESVAQVLSAEDTAWLAGMAVYPLIGRAGS